MVKNLQELDQLLKLLQSRGVLHFQQGDLEISLGPPIPQEAVVEEDDETGWRGLTRAELEIMGAQ